MKRHPLFALTEPYGSTSQVAYLRAREQGFPRTIAAAWAHVNDAFAERTDREFGFSAEPETHHREGA